MPQLMKLALTGVAVASVARANAGELPLYQPAPTWVVTATLADAGKTGADAPTTLLFDMQQRIEDGRLWSYLDVSNRMASSEILAEFATLTVPWAPDKGDLIVHELSILRGAERIDLLAKGQKFTVLRREQTLEQRELTGVLTATLAPEGLQVGDILRFKASTTSKDAALGGRVQSIAPIVAAPARAAQARMRFSWPTANAPQFRVLASGVAPQTTRKGPYTEVMVALPAPKQPEFPDDAPVRYRRPPLMEVSTFADWPDVSKVMSPLYATEGAIAPGSALALEVAAITRAETSQLRRAQRALELVQDKVRYLAVGMDGGNYVPQKPARTWDVRYGDCKAKTLLLLAILRAMDIEAEAVLANVGLGDFVRDRLPSLAAFNHILVRATIAGETVWLDGTGSGSRLADIHDTPPLRHVLPVRANGSDLMAVAMRANARPTIDFFVEADESASADLPSVFDATAVVRGAPAAMMTLAKSQLGADEQREAVQQFLQGWLGEAQISDATITTDPVAGTVTLAGRGVTTTPWFVTDRKQKRDVSHVLQTVTFTPDRGRPNWVTIPVATPDPFALRYRLRLRLPANGSGYLIEGEPDFRATLGGYQVARTTKLAGGLLTVDERVDATGAEIAPGEIGGERDRVATAKARAPRIVAPGDAARRWDLGGADPAGATQVKAIDATFGKAIANDPSEASGYTSRASFRSGIGDRGGATTDLTRAIEIEPSVELYLKRSTLWYELNDLAAASADAEAARKLDPSSREANEAVAQLKAERGDLAAAVALLDERIALGGTTQAEYRETKAALIGEFGDPSIAIKMFDDLIVEKPGNPDLMNGLCWVKGTRAVMLDSALKNCTGGMEVSSDTTELLDSRALVWYRLGRYDEALRDLDAVLASAPAEADSRFMRGIVLTRLHRSKEAALDFSIARRLEPTVDKTYARYGIKP